MLVKFKYFLFHQRKPLNNACNIQFQQFSYDKLIKYTCTYTHVPISVLVCETT